MWDRVSKTLLVIALAAPLCAWAQKSADEQERSVLEQVKPMYPELARRNGLTGVVKLRVVITPDGKAKAVEVVGGNPVFLDVATTSVKKWKWSTSDHESIQIVEIRFHPS